MWCADPVKCRLCGHLQVSVWESDDDIVPDNLECGSCGGFSCEHDEERAQDVVAQLAVKELLKKMGIDEEDGEQR